MVMRQFSRLLDPLRRRLRLMITRGVVKLVSDGLKMQELQLTALAGEVLDGVERVQNYGITSHPHAGAEAVVLNVGGVRSHAVVIAVDDRRYRLKSLAAGEVALYDDLGQMVKLSRSGIVTAAPLGHTHNGNLAVNGNQTITGTLTVNGNATITGTLIVNGVNFGIHHHNNVQTGTGSTGGPVS